MRMLSESNKNGYMVRNFFWLITFAAAYVQVECYLTCESNYQKCHQSIQWSILPAPNPHSVDRQRQCRYKRCWKPPNNESNDLHAVQTQKIVWLPCSARRNRQWWGLVLFTNFASFCRAEMVTDKQARDSQTPAFGNIQSERETKMLFSGLYLGWSRCDTPYWKLCERTGLPISRSGRYGPYVGYSWTPVPDNHTPASVVRIQVFRFMQHE